MIDLQIATNEATFRPLVLDGITWETERAGAPSKLTFTVVKDEALHIVKGFSEGDTVSLKVDGQEIFLGFIFEKSRDKEHHIRVTAYDQLRYFANKKTFWYENKRADTVLTDLCKDFKITTGEIANTGFTIKARDEDNQTLFDIVLNALDLTYDANGKSFVLYDDYGKVTLKNVEDMGVDCLISAFNAENFDYTTSIDKDTFTTIKVRVDSGEKNGDKKVRNVGVVRDLTAQKKWGELIHVVDLQQGANIKAVGDALIKLKSRKTHDLKIRGIKGDVRVRAGCRVPVYLDLGDAYDKVWMQCESVSHTFNADSHTMDITMFDSSVREGEKGEHDFRWEALP